MRYLPSCKSVLPATLFVLLFAAAVLGQEKPPATQTNDDTKVGSLVKVAAGPTNKHHETQETQSPVALNRLVTDKAKSVAKPPQASDEAITHDAEQEKPEPPSPEEEAKLRKAAQNPIASLVSVPIQENMNFGIGPHHRIQNVINIQPVIPVKLNEKWNVVARIITPIIYQPDPTTSTQGAFGFGDINPSFFFTPTKPSKLIWGVGPAFVLPTAASRTLGQGKFSMGPTIVLLLQPEKWTLGLLINNVWSVAGKQNRAAVNQGLLQYFINYNLKKGYFLTWQPTITANWRATGAQSNQRWVIPFGGGVGRIMKLGNQPVNLGLQAYANAVRPPGSSPFTLRFSIALLYPKKPKK